MITFIVRLFRPSRHGGCPRGVVGGAFLAVGVGYASHPRHRWT